MGSLAPVPRQQFSDVNGVPLAGAKVYFYESGTSTPLSAYSDGDLTTPLSNPAVADSGGFLTYYLAQVAYKIIVKTTADVTQYTVDPVGMANAAMSSGRLSTNTTAVGTVGAGTDTLMSYSLKNVDVGTNGDVVRVTGWGSFGANANVKSILFLFGETSRTIINAVAINGGAWKVVADIVRTSSATQIMHTAATYLDGAGASAARNYNDSPTETFLFSGTTIQFQGIGTADNDIRQLGMVIETIG